MRLSGSLSHLLQRTRRENAGRHRYGNLVLRQLQLLHQLAHDDVLLRLETQARWLALEVIHDKLEGSACLVLRRRTRRNGTDTGSTACFHGIAVDVVAGGHFSVYAR